MFKKHVLMYQIEISFILLVNKFEILLIIVIILTPTSTYLKECKLTLKVRSPTFQIEDTFGIPVTVKDYVGKDVIAGHSVKVAYNNVIGHVTVLVRFNLWCSIKFEENEKSDAFDAWCKHFKLILNKNNCHNKKQKTYLKSSIFFNFFIIPLFSM